MNLGLAHKVVLITGAAGDIGAAVARAFATEGAAVALLDTNRPGLARLAEEIQAKGGRCTTAPVDLTQVSDSETAIKQVLAPFGGRVDVLITTAGVCPASPLAEMLDPHALVRWRVLYEQNVLSALLPIMLVLPRMRAQSGGVILTTTSDLAAQPVPEMLPYSTAKAALAHLTHGLAAALGPDRIRVAAIAPGPVRTAIWTQEGGLIDFYTRQHALPPDGALHEEFRQRGMALPRLTEPEEIAHLLLYLASPWAAAITRCMQRFGDPLIVHFGKEDHVSGYSLVQLIETSDITCHFIEQGNAACLSIFSCASYPPFAAAAFCQQWFGARAVRISVLLRGPEATRGADPWVPNC